MPADTFSTDGVGVILMGTGNDNNTWGNNLNNSVFEVLIDAITNALTNTVTGGTLDLSGSPPPAASSQVRHFALIFNGALASNQIIKVPNLRKWWLVQNATSGAFTLTMVTSTVGATASKAIPQNSGWQIVACDGADNFIVFPFNTNQIQMPNGTGPLPAYSFVDDPTSGMWLKSDPASDGVMNGVNAVLTCATSKIFQPSWVGRRIVVSGAGAAGADLITTIQAYTSTSQVTLAANSQTAVAAALVTVDGAILRLGGEAGTIVLELNPLGQTISGIPTVAAGGSGYNVGDQITLSGGIFLRPAILTVSSVTTGAVTGVTVLDPGVYRTIVDNPIAQASTSGSGVGATFTVTWAVTNVIEGPPASPSLLPLLGITAYTASLLLAINGTALGTLLTNSGAVGPLATATTIRASALAPGAASMPFDAAQPTDNLSLVFQSTNTVSVSPGRVRDDSDVTNLQLAASITKNLSSGFVAGTTNGGCDTGTKGANQTWHIYLIGKSAPSPINYARAGTAVTINFPSAHGLGAGSTARIIGIGTGFDGVFSINSVTTTSIVYTSPVSGTVAQTTVPAGTTVEGFDVLASQSYPGPAMPSGWTSKQCLGAILSDGSSNIQQFFQYGDEFWLQTPVQDVTSFGTNGTTLKALSVPASVKVQAIFAATAVTNTSIGSFLIAYFTSPDQADQATTGASGRVHLTASQLASASVQSEGSVQARCWTNTASQIRINISQVGSAMNLITTGWRDPRRRMF